MNNRILRQTQLWTLAAGVLLSGVLGLAISARFAAGLFLTVLWAVAGFRALEGLIRASVVRPGQPRNLRALAGWAAAKLAFYAIAVWAVLASPFPAVSHLIGFSLLLVVLVAVGISALPRGGDQPIQRGDNG